MKKDLKKQNAIYVEKDFDVLDWWKENASRFKLIAPVAAIILSKPDLNGYQERFFSRCTLTDRNKLRQNFGGGKFEMNTLLSANCKLTDKRESKKERFPLDKNALSKLLQAVYNFFHPDES